MQAITRAGLPDVYRPSRRMRKIGSESAMLIAAPATPPAPSHPAADPAALHRKAEELETVFLSEMLAHAGLGQEDGAFGGGMGGAQFASFLREAQAGAMVRAGGIGLAESLFRAMSGNADA
jgi:Rod binding domain-containing protein